MAQCEACNTAEAVYHITVSVTVFGPKKTEQKLVQFMVCEKCKLAISQVMAKDPQQRQRVAWRLTNEPQLFSKFRDLRERRFAPRAAPSSDIEVSRNKNHEVHANHSAGTLVPENAAD